MPKYSLIGGKLVISEPDLPPIITGRMPRRSQRLASSQTYVNGWQGPRNPITTMGTIGRPARAWIYVGEDKSGYRVKIGMSSGPIARCRHLGVSLYSALEVIPLAAKLVETEALRLLGHKIGDGEWVVAEPIDAASAVRRAKRIVARYTHVDPELTAEEARIRRAQGVNLENQGHGA